MLGSPACDLDAIPDNDEFHNGGTIAFGRQAPRLHRHDEGPVPRAQPRPALGRSCGSTSAPFRSRSGPPAFVVITPAGNPFAAPLPNAPLVWAFGFRNPFRDEIDPVTGTIFIGDVGEASWEELDVCTAPGGNFGWPSHEGAPTHVNACGTPPPNPIAPVVQHHHLAAPQWSAAIVSLAAYRNPPGAAPFAFGPPTRAASSRITSTARSAASSRSGAWVPAAPVSRAARAVGLGVLAPNQITDGAVGPDGALYYTSLFAGLIRRIRAGSLPGYMLAGSLRASTLSPLRALRRASR